MDSDVESDGGEYVPTEHEGDSDLDTDYEDGFMDSDGIDVETMNIDPFHRISDDMVTEGNEQDLLAYSGYHPGYHDLHGPEAQSVYGSDNAWWDGSVDGEQEWGLTDGDSMSTGEGELSFDDRFSGTLHICMQLVTSLALTFCFFAEANVHVRLDSEGEYTIHEDNGEPKGGQPLI